MNSSSELPTLSINDIIDIETSKFKNILLGKKTVKLSCTFILTSGKNKGSVCLSVIKNDNVDENPGQLCSRHLKKAKSVETIDFDEPKILKTLNGSKKAPSVFNSSRMTVVMTDGEYLYETSESDNEAVCVGKLKNIEHIYR
jgi:hypothetical protein